MALEEAQSQEESPRTSSHVRKVEISDFPWILELAEKAFPNIDKKDAAKFLFYSLEKPNFLVIRTDHAFGCALFEPWPFNTNEIHAHEIFLISDGTQGWDAYNIAKEMVNWARHNNCDIMQFEPKSQLGSVMKRLGFATEQPSYRLNLKSVH